MELLAPAGSPEKLKTAVRFGADAVYCGVGEYSLRTADASLSLSELAAGVSFAHARNCKVYLVMNIFAFDNDLDQMFSYYKQAVDTGIDAVVISDPGFLYRISKPGLNTKIHLSTQANTTNSDSVKFWRQHGVQRIVLSRELSLSQIKKIKENVPDMELEIFVHGAMCIAYSGRCLLSKFMTGRSGNRGECAQPCRWEYSLREEKRPEDQTIVEDIKGTYILNSRDLCMIEHIPAIAGAGLDSLKIEGRMKPAYYVAAVTRVYKMALQSYARHRDHYEFNPEWLRELAKVSHRPYTTGFYLPQLRDDTEYTAISSYIRDYDFVGVVEEHNREANSLRVAGRNRFAVGDTIEILDPCREEVLPVEIKAIINETGENLAAAHNGYMVHIPLKDNFPGQISEYSVVRRKRPMP